jgi:hypothetical protein
MSSPTITRNKLGQFQRDDAQLRDGIIATLELVQRVACAWELFPELQDRRGHMDDIYREVDSLIQELRQVDEPKGATNDG